MTSEMIERVARAMWERNRERNREACAGVGVQIDPWEVETEGLREDWRAFARDALIAIREPSAHMIAQGERVGFGHAPSDYYTAMIDAASE